MININVGINSPEEVEVVPHLVLDLVVHAGHDGVGLHDEPDHVLGTGQVVIVAPVDGGGGGDILEAVDRGGGGAVVLDVLLVGAPVVAFEPPGVDLLGVVKQSPGLNIWRSR